MIFELILSNTGGQNHMLPKPELTEPELRKFGIDTISYRCQPYAIATGVSDEEVANADDEQDPEAEASLFIGENAALNREILFNDAFMKTGVWGTDKTLTTRWDATGGAPLEGRVEEAKLTIYQQTGKRANFMVMGAVLASRLRFNQDLIDTVNGGATPENPALIDEALFSRLFGIENIYIMRAGQNDTIDGATEVAADNTFINSEAVLIGHRAPVIGLRTPTAALVFEWDVFGTGNPIGVTEHDADRAYGTVYQGVDAFQMKVIAPELGYFIADTIS